MSTAHAWLTACLVTAIAIAPAPVAAQQGDAPTGAEPSGVAAPEAAEQDGDIDDDVFLHGFRLGYLFLMNIETPYDPEQPSGPTYAQRHDMRSPHQFLIGYEITVRMIGHDWLNVLLVSNILIGGLEQSKFFPSFNGLLGFELDESFQVGLGASVTPTKGRPAHMLIAAGWTPKVGRFYLPLHFFFVPDINAHHRIGATLGVNW